MSTVDEALQQLLAVYRDAELFREFQALAWWDQCVHVPPAGGAHRATQSAFLAKLHGQQLADPHIAEWLAVVRASSRMSEPEIAAVVRIASDKHERARRVPVALAETIEATSSEAMAAWRVAREQRDFTVFRPHLERMIALKRDEADALRDGAPDAPRHDAFLSENDPDVTTASYRALQATIRPALQPLIDALEETVPQVAALTSRRFSSRRLLALARHVADIIGLDRDWGRVDSGTAVACSHIGRNDVRILVRSDGSELATVLLHTTHETGHARYRHGCDVARLRPPVRGVASVSVDESSARLWQSIIGKLPEFWAYVLPIVRRHFPTALADVTVTEFAASMNGAARSGARVRTDDLTYCTHMGIFADIEIAMLDGSLAPRDVPEAFDAGQRELFGSSPDLLNGLLASPHWAANWYGQYPGYVMSCIRSGQLFAALERNVPQLRELIAKGQFEPIHAWMTEHIYRHGSIYPPDELMTRATGAAMDPSPWIALMHERYGPLAA